jgi:hypothetical protein
MGMTHGADTTPQAPILLSKSSLKSLKDRVKTGVKAGGWKTG